MAVPYIFRTHVGGGINAQELDDNFAYLFDYIGGGWVTPSMYGAVGDGVSNDTASVDLALATGLPVYFPLMYATTGHIIASGSDCPGVFGTGNGGLTAYNPGGAGGTTISSKLLQVRKTDFFIDRMRFVGPIQTTPGGTGPALSAGVYVGAVGSVGDSFRCTRSRFIGGATGFYLTGDVASKGVWFTDNEVSDTWADASVCSTPSDLFFQRNYFHECGYNPATTDSVCHFTTVFTGTPTENLIVTDNIVRNCILGFNYVTDRQEAMDFYGGNVRNLVVARNVISDVLNGGFEFKSILSAAVPDFYGDALVTENVVNFKTTRFDITNITQDAIAGEVTTSAAHGWYTGYIVFLSDVSGMSDVNNTRYTITVTGTTTFTIGVATSGYGAYSSGGKATNGSGIGVALNGFAGGVTNITKFNPGTVTTYVAHGLATGDSVYFNSVQGMTQVNGKAYTIVVTGASTFTIVDTSGGGFSAYTGGGSVAARKIGITAITKAALGEVTTAQPHNLLTGDSVVMSAVSGMTEVNGITYTATVVSATKFTIGVNTTGAGYTAYTSGGSIGEAVKPIIRWTVSNNKFIADYRGTNTTAVSVTEHDNTIVKGNVADKPYTGVSISPGGGYDATVTGVTIDANILDVEQFGVSTDSTRTVTNLSITNNQITSAIDSPIYLQGGRVNNLKCTGNNLVPPPGQYIAQFNNVQGGVIAYNTGKGTHAGMVFGGTASTSLRIVHNDINCVFDAFSFATASATIVVQENTVTNATTGPIIGGTAAATVRNVGNKRNPVTADPSGTQAGAVGDIAPHYAPASLGVSGYICTTAGVASAAVWKGFGVIL